MAQNIPPQGNIDDDAIYGAMQKLQDDSRIVRSAHFIASQRKGRYSRILGILVIILNGLIGSGLIEAVIANQNRITTTIKALAFAAAALATIQTFFNFQKEVECHIKSGGVYSSIYHRIAVIMAQYKQKPADRDAMVTKFNALSDEYLKANDDSAVCIPTDGDYDEARAGIEGRGGRKRAKRAGVRPA